MCGQKPRCLRIRSCQDDPSLLRLGEGFFCDSHGCFVVEYSDDEGVSLLQEGEDSRTAQSIVLPSEHTDGDVKVVMEDIEMTETVARMEHGHAIHYTTAEVSDYQGTTSLQSTG